MAVFHGVQFGRAGRQEAGDATGDGPQRTRAEPGRGELADGPRPGQRGPQHATLVDEHAPSLQARGFSLMRGHWVFTRPWIPSSSRSIARRAGFWDVQLRRAARRRLPGKLCCPLRAEGRMPAPSASPVHAKHPSHLDGRVAPLQQIDGAGPPPLQIIGTSRGSHSPSPPKEMTGRFLCRWQ